ncbi:MAG: hypothetical protein PVF74_02595 [Anaerolineales bacterium]|jgi:hypothetical protein
MTFLTIFTAPKPFTDPHINTIQRNAILSWLNLGPEVEVLIVGEESGMQEVAAEYGVRQLPDVTRNDFGTPHVKSIFALARQASDSPMLAYVNADIMLLPDFVEAARTVSGQLDNFLVIGQRWNLEITAVLDFSPGWDQRLEEDIETRGELHRAVGSDYFIFPHSLFIDMPDFAIGRPGWDNWMIYHAQQENWPVVDGTPSITVVHQNHDYSHLPGGKPPYTLPEGRLNKSLAGADENLYMISDSDKQLTNGKIHTPRMTLPRAVRRVEIWLRPSDGKREGLRGSLAHMAFRLRKKLV